MHWEEPAALGRASMLTCLETCDLESSGSGGTTATPPSEEPIEPTTAIL